METLTIWKMGMLFAGIVGISACVRLLWLYRKSRRIRKQEVSLLAATQLLDRSVHKR